MSIKQGKSKNWGSRTGKSPKKQRSSHAERALLSKLPSGLLQKITDSPESLREEIGHILGLRQSFHTDHTKPKLALETKLGKLFQGDCISFLEAQGDETIDCIFADPPFNLRKDYDGSETDDLPDEVYLEWTREWLALSVQKLKVGGSLFVYNIPKWSIQIADFLNSRLTFRNWIAVDMTFSMPIPKKLYPSHYSLLYFIKGERPTCFSPPRLPIKTCVRCGQEQNDYGGYKLKMNPQGLNLRDVWTDIPPVRHSKYKNRDANELSLRMLDRVLDIATKEGDLVFDPFGGSGTTYIAAEIKKRRWLGTELGDCQPIIERFNGIGDDRAQLAKHRGNINTLFTDRALELRIKSGLPIDNYRIEESQVHRVLKSKRPGSHDLEM